MPEGEAKGSNLLLTNSIRPAMVKSCQKSKRHRGCTTRPVPVRQPFDDPSTRSGHVLRV